MQLDRQEAYQYYNISSFLWTPGKRDLQHHKPGFLKKKKKKQFIASALIISYTYHEEDYDGSYENPGCTGLSVAKISMYFVLRTCILKLQIVIAVDNSQYCHKLTRWVRMLSPE